MSLTQLLSDLGAAIGLITLTASVPLGPRIAIGVLLMIGVLMLVHASVGGYTMFSWLFLLGRSRFLPTQTIFRPQGEEIKKGEPGPVQESWIQLTALDHGVAGVLTPRQNRDEPDANYWVIVEVESLQNTRFLAEAEQVRIYGRFKLFLDGLGFPLKCISLVEAADAARDPALVAQRHALSALGATPQLQKLQQQSLLHQHGSLQHCTTTRHFVVISASTSELARQRGDGTARSPLLRLFELVAPKKQPAVTPEQVKHELRIRVSLVKKALQHLDVQATVLDDAEALQVYAACLAPGTLLPSFEVEVLDERELAQQARSVTPTAVAHTSAVASAQSAVAKSSRAAGSTERAMSPRSASRTWKKRIQGLDRAFVYSSTNAQTRLEQDAVRLADLVAPSAVSLLKDAVEVTVRGEKRHLRYYEVIGFAPDLLCGWQEELTSLALPMIVTTRCHPIESRLMIRRLELHLTKLESQKLADQKALRLTKVDQNVEAEQVRSVIDALARKKLTIFAVQMVIGIHAGDPERLEQRAKYLLSHLREMQLRVRALGRQHDRGWQACGVHP